MRRAVVVDVVRSPFGRARPGGALEGCTSGRPLRAGPASARPADGRRPGHDRRRHHRLRDPGRGAVGQHRPPGRPRSRLSRGRSRRNPGSKMRFGPAGVRLRRSGRHCRGVRRCRCRRRRDDEPCADAREPHGQGQRRARLSPPLPRRACAPGRLGRVDRRALGHWPGGHGRVRAGHRTNAPSRPRIAKHQFAQSRLSKLRRPMAYEASSATKGRAEKLHSRSSAR